MNPLKTKLALIVLFAMPLLAFTTGDTLRIETNINQVYSQYGLTGKGTVVAIIDRGIDYRHPDFIDSAGNTRIAFIFDMLDDAGKNDPDNSYGVGTIYDQAEINQALNGGPDLPTMDRHGHGIASTGIAAGDGSGIASRKYRGVAYGATIIAVKAFTDNFPPFGGNPGQTGVFNPDYLEIALQFVADKMDEIGLPSVTLMNLGSIGGPTDGTSSVCRAMDAFTAPGRLLVCGVGDDGGNDNRASGNFIQGDTLDLQIYKGVAGNLRLDLWYEGEDRVDVIIRRPDGSQLGPFAGPADNNAVADQFPAGIFFYHRGSNVAFFGAQNDKREILVDITADTGTYHFMFIGQTITQGAFSASLNPSTYSWNNKFLTHVQEGGSINDYASAFNVITPTDYVIRNTWTDLSGTFRQIIGQGDKGELWVGSSSGPTIDGRLGVDVAVPGEILFTSYSPDTWYSWNSHLLINDGEGKYGLQNAVSAAAPVLTGVLALMLGMDSTLDPMTARTILHQTARSDNFTGTTPNIHWGHGKLDALAAVQMVESMLPLETVYETGIRLFPNPAHGSVRFEWEEAPVGAYSVRLMDISGREIKKWTGRESIGELDTEDLGKGIYLLRFEVGEKAVVKKLVVR